MNSTPKKKTNSKRSRRPKPGPAKAPRKPKSPSSLGVFGDTEKIEQIASIAPAPRDSGLAERAQALMTSLGLSVRSLADSLGLRRGVLGAWLSGDNGPGYSAATIAELERVIGDWVAAQSSRGVQGPANFIDTTTAKRVMQGLAFAQTAGTMALVYGAPGVGKSRAIAEYASQHEHVWVATISPSGSGILPALEAVAEACGVDAAAGSGARRLARTIGARVSGLSGLLIIDEAQHLSLAALEELRSIHDACGVGLALAGNEIVYTRLTGGARAAHFAQLFSRVGMRVHVRTPESMDVEKVAARFGVAEERSVALLVRVSQRPGALRGVIQILRAATRGGGAASYDRIRGACEFVGAEVE